MGGEAPMRIGTLAYATEQGLGYLAKSFYDAGVVTDVCVVAHGRRPEQPWYPGAMRIDNLRQACNVLGKFLPSIDVMLFFETCFHYQAMEACRALGIPTVVMPMYECTPKDHPQPDAWLSPSLLDYQYYGVWDAKHPIPKVEPFQLYYFNAAVQKCAWTPVPVEVPWKERTHARVFVHNAGHGGLKGRNGTAEFIAALKHVTKPIEVLLRSQDPLPGFAEKDCKLRIGEATVFVRIGSVPREDLYSQGDVFVFPEKFNGLSLPLQEAFASGMLVMATDRFPNNWYLPTEPLIGVRKYVEDRISPRCNAFKSAVVDPLEIARTMDWWYGRGIAHYSHEGRAYAEANSWKALKPRYEATLAGLLTKTGS